VSNLALPANIVSRRYSHETSRVDHLVRANCRQSHHQDHAPRWSLDGARQSALEPEWAKSNVNRIELELIDRELCEAADGAFTIEDPCVW